MSGDTLDERQDSNRLGVPNDGGEVVELTTSSNSDKAGARHKRNGLYCFFSELRRRKVCRAATAYCIALWLACQVVEVVSPSLGLPDWTLELVIVLGLGGFPIALILSWLFEVTPSGLVFDSEAESRGIAPQIERPRTRFDQVVDSSLLLVALGIGAQLALTSIGSNLKASPVPAEELYVSPFPVVSQASGAAFSSALQVELQHEISRLPTVKVFVPADTEKLTKGSSLTGSVSITDKEIQVAALIVSNQTGELAWSQVLRLSIKESGGNPRSVAKHIVNALEDWSADMIQGDQNGG